MATKKSRLKAARKHLAEASGYIEGGEINGGYAAHLLCKALQEQQAAIIECLAILDEHSHEINIPVSFPFPGEDPLNDAAVLERVRALGFAVPFTVTGEERQAERLAGDVLERYNATYGPRVGEEQMRRVCGLPGRGGQTAFPFADKTTPDEEVRAAIRAGTFEASVAVDAGRGGTAAHERLGIRDATGLEVGYINLTRRDTYMEMNVVSQLMDARGVPHLWAFVQRINTMGERAGALRADRDDPDGRRLLETLAALIESRLADVAPAVALTGATGRYDVQYEGKRYLVRLLVERTVQG